MSRDTQHLSLFYITITADTIKSLLHATKHGQPLPETSLSDLHLIKSVIPNGLPKPVYDHMLIDVIANRITHNLNAHRHVHNLPSVQPKDRRETLLDHLQADFKVDDMRLQAWSILHMTFVRVDVGIVDKELAKFAMVSPRTLRRRRLYGYDLLLISIFKDEVKLNRPSGF